MKIKEISESVAITKYNKHMHNTYEIAFVLSGNMHIVAGKNEFDAASGDVLILPPQTEHQGVWGKDFINIFLQATDLDFSDITFVHDNDGSIRNLFFMLRKVASEKEENYMRISDSLLNALCEYIKKYSASNFKYGFVLDIKNMIYDNISNSNFNLSEAIKKSGFNTDYFRRCFREELSVTPLEYLTNMRLERAKELLIQRSFISIEKVAESCGFSDCFYFSKTFKKHLGISPRDYRKSNKLT